MKYFPILLAALLFTASCQQQAQTNEKKSKEMKKQNSVKKYSDKENKTSKKDKSKKQDDSKNKPKEGEIKDDTVMAEYNGKKILFKDIKDKYADKIKETEIQIKTDNFKDMSVKVEKFAMEKLLNEEAEKQGLKSHKDLLDKITSKVPQPTEKEINEMKTKYAKQFAARKMKDEEITKLVKDYIMNQKKNDIAFNYIKDLKKKAGFKITLPAPDIPALKIKITENNAFKGPKDAKYVIVEFSDFQCPYCARIAPVISEITKNNKDIKVVFKHFPLSFHKMAKKAAIAAQCVNQQGKFWQFHDKVFANQKDLNEENLKKWVKELGIDMKKYETCIKSPETEKIINEDLAEGMRIKVKGTPSVFLNGRQINAMTSTLLNEEIDSERNKIKGPLTNNTVIAEMNGKKYTWNDFLKENRNFKAIEKSNTDRRLYELYSQLLSQDLSKKILEDEAKKQGLKNADEYIKKMIDSIKDPDEKELKDLYERLKPQLQGKKFEEIKPQLIQYAKAQKGQELVRNKMKELSEKYKVKITMPLPQSPKFDIDIENSPIMGDKNAKHTLIEFSDFQCPYCARASKFTEDLLKKYPKKIKVVFKHFPLPFHKDARGAALASYCFQKQGKFREFYVKAFENQDKLNKAEFEKMAKEFKLDMEKYKKCLDSKEAARKIDKDLNDGQELGVQGTPTLYLDGKLYNGPREAEKFSEYLK